MHATKETCILNYAAMMIAAVVTLILGRRVGAPGSAKGSAGMKIPLWHVGLVVLSGALCSMLFYSSFFRHPQGILDSITTYAVYFTRAGVDDAHLHPWHYYLGLLMANRDPSGFFWSEAWLILPALAGFMMLLLKKDRDHGEHFLLFAGIYTWTLMIMYSIISYKTPWNVLQFYYGMLLLAAYGGVSIWRLPAAAWLRLCLRGLLLVGAVHWLYGSFSMNYRHCSNPANPWVYAHTSEDVKDISEAVCLVSDFHPEEKEMQIDIIIPDHEYWPLPWYLRDFPHAAWMDQVEQDQVAAPLIIAAASVEKELILKLYELPPPGQRYLYLSLFSGRKELRPGQELRVYLRKDIWDHLPEDMKQVD
jgi:hypothetical protein